jgi:thioredoxin reductase
MVPYYLPRERLVRFTRSYLGPSGSWWLRSRFEGNVAVHTRTTVVRAEEANGKVKLSLRDASGAERTMEADHVIAGTGYEPDLDRLPFLDRALLARLRRVERSPALSRHFEASVPGLYFVGLAAAFSFGPLVRFVCGADFAAPRVVDHVTSRRAALLRRFRTAAA